MSIDLEQLGLKELKDLHARVTKALNTFEERRKKAALTELEEKARELGFSLNELTGASAPRKRSVITAKYANPADPEQTWSGRGRKPHWYVDALAAGRSEADLLV